MFKYEYLGPGNLSRRVVEVCFSRCPICGHRLEDNGTCKECGYTGDKKVVTIND